MNSKAIRLAAFVLSIVFASITQAATTWSAQDYDLYSGDFNGDGIADVLYIAKDPTKSSGIFSTGSVSALSPASQNWPSNYLGIPWSSNLYAVVIGDFNGDGQADILLQRKTPGDSYLLLTGAVGAINAISQTIPYNALGLTWSADEHKIQAGDFNGDGKAELFFQATSSIGLNAIVPANANGQFTLNPIQTWNDTYLGYQWSTKSSSISVGNFFGKPDGVPRDGFLIQARPTIVMIDYDVAIPVPVYKPNSNGFLRPNGDGTLSLSSILQSWNRNAFGADWSPLLSNTVVGDFNADGVTDVLLQAKATGRSSYLFSVGNWGTLSTGVALPSNINWSADATKLVITNAGRGAKISPGLYSTPRAGVYFQALSDTGTGSYTPDISGTSITLGSDFLTNAQSAERLPKSAGSTPGEPRVDSNGNASYSMPLKLPAGINGLTPELSIDYHQNGSYGNLGTRWSVGSFPGISRCPSTLAQNGSTSGVTEVTTDRYCLGGNQLQLTSAANTYGLDGSTYRTELETFSKIVAHGSTGAGPEWFEVFQKDGLIHEYGNTADSRTPNTQVVPGSVVRTWLLNTIRDRSGNYIRFDYLNGAVTTISYGGNTTRSITPAYKVSFNLKTVLNTQTSQMDTLDVLNDVKVTYLDAPVRQYTFSYYEQGNGAPWRRLLSSVQECGVDTTDCLPPTRFNWSQGTAGFDNAQGGTQSAPLPSAAYPMDMNGDGFDDLVYYDPASVHWKVMLGSASGYGAVAEFTGVNCTSDAVVMDFDNDGRTDLLTRSAGYWWWLRYQANGTMAASNTGLAFITTVADPSAVAADVDGDGYQDLVSVSIDNVSLSVAYHRHDGTAGFESPVPVTYLGSEIQMLMAGKPQSTNRSLDVNGDGRQDILVLINDQWRVFYSQGTSFVGDTVGTYQMPTSLTGNNSCSHFLIPPGLTSPPGTLGLLRSKCLLSGGSSLRSMESTTFYGKVVLADWDTDGQEDVITKSGNTADPYWLAFRSTGDSSVLGPNRSYVVNPATSIPVSEMAGNVIVSDIDGDGLSDLTYVDANGKWVSRRHKSGRSEQLTTVTDGFGNTVTFNYQQTTAASGGCYSRDSSIAAPILPDRAYFGPLTVVCGLSRNDGIGGNYTLSYQYYNATINLQGRGFRGFERRTVTDSRTGVMQREDYRQAFPFNGMVKYAVSTQSDGKKITEVTNSLASVDSAAMQGVISRYPYVSSSTLDKYEVGGTSNGNLISESITSTTLDAYGNQTLVASTVQDKDAASPYVNKKYKTEVNSAVTNDTGTNWCLGLSTQVTTTRMLLGATSLEDKIQVHTQSADVDPVHCRVDRQTIEPASSTLKVVTDYVYDPAGCGQATSVSIKGRNAAGTDNLDSRVTTLDYGTACLRPETITNPLGQEVKRIYRYDLGLLTKETDPNGVATQTEYDNHGRTKRVIQGDGTYTDIAYSACNAANNYCGVPDLRLQVLTTQRDSAGVEIRKDYAFLDSYGRTRFTKQPLANGVLSNVETTYDANGRVLTQSVPYVSASNGKTVYAYDLIGRQTLASLQNASGGEVRRSSAQYLGHKLILTDPLNNNKTKLFDVTGQLRKVTDPAVAAPSTSGSTDYDYTFEAGGIPKATVTDAASNVSITRKNVRGFVVQAVDPDTGTSDYEYDSLGELTKQTDAEGIAITFGAYDPLGRPTTRVVPGEGTTQWTWGVLSDNTSTAKYVGQLKKIEVINSGYFESYVYDQLSRPAKTTINIPSDTAYDIDYSYATNGEIDTLTYPTSTSSYRLKLKYDYQYGMQTKVSDANAPATVFWQLNDMDARGNATDEMLGNGVRVMSGFDPVTGLSSYRQSGAGGSVTNRQNLSYLWDANGNLSRRTDNNQAGLYESFTYDSLNRLRSSSVVGSTGTLSTVNLAVDAIGNITNKSDVGAADYNYTTQQSGCSYYGHVQPHAVRNAGNKSYCYDKTGNMTKRGSDNISWTNYGLPSVINSGTLSSTFSYGPDRERYKQVATYSGGTSETTLYIGGLLEKVTTTSGSYAFRHYIGAGSSTVMYQRWSTGSNQTYYVTTDHLGSSSAITDSAGALSVNESFDPFGKRRGANWVGNPNTGDLTTIANSTRHGYTGHEHLDNLGLIHMNGRVQDPILGRFLSADPYVPEPDHSQSLNRYSYVRNNPLRAIDPSGFEDMETIVVIGEKPSELPNPPPPRHPVDRGDPYKEVYGADDVKEWLRGNSTGGGDGPSQSTAANGKTDVGTVVVTGTMPKPPTPPKKPFDWKSIDWEKVAVDWWPGYGLGTCISNALNGGACSGGEVFWAAVGVVPIPEGALAKWTAGAARGAAATAKGAETIFKTAHYASRLEKAGVGVARAESEVAKAVGAMRPNMVESAAVSGRMTIDGVLIEYRAMMLPNGTVNVGTIFPVVP